MLTLSRLEAASRPAAAEVAVRAGHVIVWADFIADVEALAAAVAERGTGRWLLFAEDSYAFVVGLIALWQGGSIAVVPPNGQAGTLAERGAGSCGLITDQDVGFPGLSVLRPEQAAPPARWVWRTLDAHTPRLELLTSGTTGAPKAIPKTLSNLDEEVGGLEARWGARLEGRHVFATVSHHHIYGLLFRLLWPVCAGRPFRAETYLHAAELVARLLEAERATLVTAPVHLRRLRASQDFRKLGRACSPIFSSGGPLDESTADAIAEAFGEGALEIFGSTETGGVAWRQQQPGPERLAWTLFAKVTARKNDVDDRLVVDSPFVSAPGPESRFLMEDRAEFLPDGRFLLRGRADRVVKVGETRVFLPEMEERLREHRYVTEATLTLLDRPPEVRIGAAVVLSDEGRRALALEGRRVIATALTEFLRLYCAPAALPRSWRYVDRLPMDQQGKMSAEAVRALFAPSFDPSVTSPELLSEARESGSCERTLRVPPNLAYLQGHFPGFPVVPGVAQIKWVMDVARTLVGREMRLAGLEALKFKELLRPGQVFQLRVDVGPAPDTLTFRLWTGGTVFASGRGRLVPVERGRG
jgi:acyl-coenzyme A synthetase/AMP-(fatty) acid ligase